MAAVVAAADEAAGKILVDAGRTARDVSRRGEALAEAEASPRLVDGRSRRDLPPGFGYHLNRPQKETPAVNSRFVALVAVLAPTFVATAIAARPLVASDSAPEGKWIQLFNGKDLTGWKVKITGHELGDNFANTFRVVDGLLTVAYDGYESFDGRFGHIFHEREFSNYLLRTEYRFVGEQVRGGPGWALRNSGVMIHGQKPETIAKDQNFPVSIEVQLLGGSGSGERTTSNLCTPGTNVVMGGKLITRHCTNSKSKTYHGDQWVTALVEVRGDSVRHIIDGETVLAYSEPQLDPKDADARRLLAAGEDEVLRGGTISLQSESHPVQFRKVEILPLDLDDPDADDKLPTSGWTDLLAGGTLAKHWSTTGNWTLDAGGVVSLAPRPGETGWSRFDSYLWLEGEYQDFEFEFEYKVAERGNSGFYFHVGDRANPVAQGIEVQIYDSHRKGRDAKLTDHDSGGIIPGVPPTKNSARPAGEWNRFRIVCEGSQLTVRLNGEVVNEVDLDSDKFAGRPAKGSIGFQDHALPLWLRNLQVRKL